MLKKEIHNALIQSLWFASAALVMPALLTLFMDESWFELFFPTFQFGLLFWAFFLGNFLFFLERGQGGLEYVFSLPYSRLRLIGMKILPRAAVAVIFLLLHFVIYTNGGENVCAFNLFIFTWGYLILFVIGFSLSAASDNFVVSAFITFLAMWIFAGLALAGLAGGILLKGLPLREFLEYTLHQFVEKPLLWPPVFILLAAFPLTFLRSVRRLDIRPAAAHNRRFLKQLGLWLIPGFAVIILSSFLVIDDFHTSYYLTRNNQLIESRLGRVRIHDGKNVHQLESVHYIWSFWNHIETENALIVDAYLGRSFEKQAVISIDLSTRTIKTLYEINLRKFIDRFWRFERELLLLEKDSRNRGVELVRIDLDGGGIRRLPLRLPGLKGAPGEDYYQPLLVGTDTLEGRRFWLLASGRPWDHPLLQIFEDGTIRDLGTHPKRPRYVNRHLVVPGKDRIEIFRLTDEGPEKTASLPGGFHPMDQALRDFTLPGRAILGYVADRHLSSLDLEEFTLTPLPELRLLGTSDGREFYLGRKTEEGISCAHWKDGALRTVKDIPSDFSTNEQPILHGHGFLISQGGRIRIIGYPDLEEIRFKGLKMRR